MMTNSQQRIKLQTENFFQYKRNPGRMYRMLDSSLKLCSFEPPNWLACFVEIFERYVYQQTNCGKLSVSPGILSLPSIDTINKVGRGVLPAAIDFHLVYPPNCFPSPLPAQWNGTLFSHVLFTDIVRHLVVVALTILLSFPKMSLRDSRPPNGIK